VAGIEERKEKRVEREAYIRRVGKISELRIK